MTDRFHIYKTNESEPGYNSIWALDYPHGYSDVSTGQNFCSWEEAVSAFLAAVNNWCPMCGKGDVVDTDWGWKCEGCGRIAARAANGKMWSIDD